jgi:hypothetical protein
MFAADPAHRKGALRLAKWYAGAAFACAAATLINPYTYHLHAHIYQFFSEPYHVQNISEYQSISFHEPAALYMELLLLLGGIGALWLAVQRKSFVPLVLVLGWGHLALFAARNVPLFAIIAAPLIGRAFNEMIDRARDAGLAPWFRRLAGAFQSGAAEFGETDALWRLHAASAAVMAVITLLLLSPAATGKLKAEYDPKRYPAEALSILRDNPNSRIFADDEWGDYLVYNLYPRQKVFIDGRDDFYGQDFEQKYLDLMTMKYDWERYLGQYKIDTIVLSPKAGLATVIKESRNWRVVHDDTVAVVFRAVEKGTPPQEQVSTTAAPGEKNRDAKLTKTMKRDLRIAKTKTGV